MTPTDEAPTSVHTTSLPELLTRFGITILVSTYQAGKLIIVRADEGKANTHFRTFHTPMGVAYDRNRLAVGTHTTIWDFRNQPAVAAKLEPLGKYDACFLPRQIHYTGQIAIHEIAWSGSELWAVNTRFSCLCTIDRESSFVPQWRPPFISALAPEDRCHLNGVSLVNGVPKFVSVLGTTDTAGGWRENKRNGGLLMEVPSGRVIATGLSMPHSPRWYEGKLWFLESGDGTLSTCDPATGKTTVIARMPGFTRGLDFFGPFAFVGLSQVRETAVFSGLPLTDRIPVEERSCGMWVIDTRNGQMIAFLRFEAGVREVFAVTVLPGIKFPELFNEPGDEHIATSYVLPDEALVDVAK